MASPSQLGSEKERTPGGEVHELEQLAGPLGVLRQEGGEAVTLWGMGDREGGGLVARGTHVAPHCRHVFAVQENSDVHGLAGVRLLHGCISNECRQAGLMRAHITCRALDGVRGSSSGSSAGGSGSSSDVSAGCEGSGGLRPSASPSLRPASWVAVPWDASTSMGGGGALPRAGLRFPGWARWHWAAHLGRAQGPVHLRGLTPHYPHLSLEGPPAVDTGHMGGGTASDTRHTNPGSARPRGFPSPGGPKSRRLMRPGG